VLIIVSTRFILNPLLKLLVRFSTPEIFTASALLLVLGSARALEHVGLSMAMGAFIAGLLIADSSYRHQILAEIQPFRGLLLGLFFMTMGMSLDLDRFLETPLALITAATALMTVKFLVLWPLSRLFGLQANNSVAVALLLAQCGEFALVLFALASVNGLLDEIVFQQLLIVVLLSMLATPALEKLAYRFASASHKSPGSKHAVEMSASAPDARPVILAGFGRMGRRIGFIMELMKVPYVAIDKDGLLVDRERAAGKSVYFGDAVRPDVLRAAGVAEAPLVIVTIDDLDAAERVVLTLHSAFPGVPVFVRGHDRETCRELLALGANFTVSETLEASAGLARVALLHMGADSSEVTVALNKFRKDYYRRINNRRV